MIRVIGPKLLNLIDQSDDVLSASNGWAIESIWTEVLSSNPTFGSKTDL